MPQVVHNVGVWVCVCGRLVNLSLTCNFSAAAVAAPTTTATTPAAIIITKRILWKDNVLGHPARVRVRVSQYVVPGQAKNSYQIASNCRLSRSSSRAFNRCRYSSPHPALPPCPVTRPLHAITHFNRPPSLNCLPGCRFLAHVSALSRSFSPLPCRGALWLFHKA